MFPWACAEPYNSTSRSFRSSAKHYGKDCMKIKPSFARTLLCSYLLRCFHTYPSNGKNNPIAYGEGGGGGGVGTHHQTGSYNFRTLSPRVSKISDFFFMPLDTLWQNFRWIDLPGGLLQSFFEQEVMKNKGYEHFCFCLK